MGPNSLLLVLLFAASAAALNGTARGRTFGIFDVPGRTFGIFPDGVTDEPIPTEYGFNQTPVVRNGSMTIRQRTTEGALVFLTGPVSTILMPSVYTVVCVISVPINILAVLAFARRIRPKKPAAIYMLNLACADLIFSLLLPFKIAYHFGGNNWIFGSLMCRVFTAAFYWNMYCSVLLIACISVDRLLAVVYPIDSLTWRRPRNSVIACVSMWILSFAVSVPLVHSEQTFYLRELDITTCHDIQPIDALLGHYKIYFITLCCFVFFLPLLIIVVSYTWVISSLSRVPHGVPGHSRRRTRAVVMAVTVLVIFLLCFTPTNCLLLAHYLQFDRGVLESQQTPDGSYAAYLVFMCLGSLNCVLDPLVYYFGSSQCQRQLSKMLKCSKTAESASLSSCDSRRSSSRTILKSRCTETSNINTNSSSFQQNLNSQYKKLLV